MVNSVQGTKGVGNYFSINGLRMYYEIHGSGSPLVLLHGGITTIESSFGAILPALAQNRQVIAIEQQGHGRTADVDRPMNFVQMADDSAALLRHLQIKNADFFGFSDGGIVGLGIAIRHPDLVCKLAIGGTNYNNDGLYPENLEFMKHIDLDQLGELRDAYVAVAPNPENWPTLVAKVMQMGLDFPGWPREELQRIRAHTLIIIGDSDIVRPEHAVEMFRLIPNAHLAVLPRTGHFLRLATPDWILSMLNDFFDAPIPQ